MKFPLALQLLAIGHFAFGLHVSQPEKITKRMLDYSKTDWICISPAHAVANQRRKMDLMKKFRPDSFNR